MSEINFIELLDYCIDKYAKLAKENEKLRITNINNLEVIKEERNKATSLEHRNMHLSTKLEQQMKENTRILQSIDDLQEEIEKLKGEEE